MESLEVSAKTVPEAIALALARLGLTREEVQVSVLSEGRQGLWGIGSEDARVLVTPLKKEPDLAPLAQEVLEELLARMGVAAQVTLRSAGGSDQGPTPPVLDIHGQDLGILIGRRGATLTALQFITNLILSHRLRQRVQVTVDVESYRVRREASLRGLAERMAERVRTTQQPVTLEAMPAHERRIVHLALAGSPHVSTQSIGQDDDRKVVIVPQKRWPSPPPFSSSAT